ncbi:dTDP-4-dehydrorhamnose 3,5-epimerase [Sphingomonas gilva]|uniref:dTDP-4-dehydrorhamnose 3,5-epimerase n=1 Tax=Sphingomonas gilva TaxID=2305907 RepID=A0A396RNA9_9SPHN|nr:dTDP-4-dehydrorhamnose 3,5-epimerase [Sphingomonas gilva]RHW16662.1 dTDP-4-dehydrorhamnose 3,5-epimerase [Sphingomonas gilva]
MIVRDLAIPGVKEIVPARHGDARGFFSETWNRVVLAGSGVDLDFVQDNHSMSAARGVLRGLHFQVPPFAQDKLVRVVRGSIYDVAVDIREGSPSFGQWVGLVVSAEAWNQILVPKGFAHGFVTLEPDCEVIYKVTAPYSPEHDRGIAHDDPALAIDWPVAASERTLSDKDRAAPRLAAIESPFSYGAAV